MNVGGWLGEKARYFLRWPVNLVRDFPIRLLRLFETLQIAGRGMLFLLPELIDAVRYDEPGRWLRFKLGRILNWFHRLLAQLFDLLGGPEIAQFLLHFFAHTAPLTDDEIALMSRIVGPQAMRYREIRVAQGGILNLIFKYNGNLAFATWRTINIPTRGRHTRSNRAIIAHELTHVYQYEQIGSRYLGEAIFMLVKTKRDCYDYGGPHGLSYACAAGARFADFNREQQAMIVQDYCMRIEDGSDASAYVPFIEELQRGLL